MNPNHQVVPASQHKLRTAVTIFLVFLSALILASIGIVFGVSYFFPKDDSAIKQDEKAQKNVTNTIDKDQLVYILDNLSSVINTLQEIVAGYDQEQYGSTTEITALALTAKNLIRNSSFESATGVSPRQWRYILDSTTDNTKQSTEGIRSGNYGLKFFPSNGENGYDLGISQDVTITVPERTYVLSGYIKITNVNSDAKVRIGFWNNYKNTYGPMEEIALSGTKDWYRVSINVTTDGLITDWSNWYPVIEVRKLKSGYVYLDDVQLEEGSIETTYASAQAGKSGVVMSTYGDGSILSTVNGTFFPTQSGVGSLGTTSNRWRDLYLLKATINENGDLSLQGDASVGGDLTVNDSATFNGNVTFGNNSSDTFTFNGSSSFLNGITVGQNGEFAINSSGNITKINNVSYSFPSAQGSANEIIINDGSGNLTWGTFGAASVTADSLDFAQFKDAMTVDADTSVNLYDGAANRDLRFYNSNSSSEMLFLDGSTGRVGIGTTNPSQTLDVIGNIRAGTEFYKGSIALGATGSSNITSGAYLVGAFDEFDHSTAPTVQGVLNDLDSVIGSLSAGTTGPWIKSSNFLYPAFAEYLGNPATSGSNKLSGVFLSDNSSVVYGTDNDFRTVFNGTNFIFGDTSNTFLSVTDSGSVGTFAFNIDDLYINSSGNVGIGTTTINDALEVSGGAVLGSSYVGTTITAPANGLLVEGNVGIGTTLPQSALHVNGAQFRWTDATADIGFLLQGAAGYAEIRAAKKSDFTQYEDLILNKGGGNVGIGITSPASALDIDAASNTLGIRLRGTAETTEIADIFVAGNGQLWLSNQNTGGSQGNIALDPEDDLYGVTIFDGSTGVGSYTNFYVTDAATDFLNIVVNQATSLTAGLFIDDDDQIGIGVTNPASALDIDASSNTLGLRLRGVAETSEIADMYVSGSGQLWLTTQNTGGSQANIALDAEDDQYGVSIVDSNTGSTVFANLYTFDAALAGGDYLNITFNNTNATPGLVINDSDNVGIGTSSPTSKLDVVGTVTATDLSCTDCLEAGNIATGAVATAEILDATILTGDIATDTILAGNIAAGAVGTSEIADGTVSSTDILDATILTGDIATDTILAGNIAADSVGDSELFNGGSWTLASTLNITGADVGLGITPVVKLDIDTGSNTDGLRLRGVAETSEIADMYVGTGGQLVLSTTNTTDTSAFIEIDTNDNQFGLIIRDSTTPSTVFANLYMFDSATSNGDYLYIAAGSAVNTGLLGLSINYAGNVGIGTTSPLVKLDVVGTVDATDFTCTDCIDAAAIATSAITTTEILDNTIGAGDIAADAITASELATSAVTTTEILDSTILTGDIALDTILAGDIAAGAVGTSEIADGTVSSTDILDNTILAGDIAADAITASELATSAVTTTEILDSTILTGDISADTILAGDIAADAIGDSELFNGGVWNITSNLSIQGDNVGIGGTATTAALTLFNTAGSGLVATSTNAHGVYGKSTTASGAGVYALNSASGGVGLYATGSGNAVIGLSSHATFTAGYFQNTSSGPGLAGDSVGGYGVQGSSVTNYALYGYRNQVTSIVGRFENDTTYCQVVPGGTGYTCPSDSRLKKDVSTIDNALDKVMNLRGIKYHWKTDTSADPLELGFIAQEVEQVVPELVYTDPDNGIKSMGYGNLTPLLVNAVQEQQAMIDGNENKLFELSDSYTDLSFVNSSLDSRINKIESAMAQIQNTPIESFALPELPIEIVDLQTEVDLIKNNQTPIESKLSELSDSVLALEEKVNGLMNENDPPQQASDSASFEDLPEWRKEADDRLDRIETIVASLQGALLEDSSNTEQLANSEEKVTLADLTVTGKTNLYDVGVIGQINAGLLVIDGIEGKISSLGTALKIQEEPTAPVEIMAGKVLIDKKGNLTLQEEVTAKKYNVDTSDNEVLSIGEALIQKGQKEILINTKSVTDKSKIFLTPKTELGVPVSVIEQKDGEYFKVSIKDEADTDVVFNWWVVN